MYYCTALAPGVPNYLYPGVHLNPVAWRDGKRYPTMTQCTATPANLSDPTLVSANQYYALRTRARTTNRSTVAPTTHGRG